MNPKLDIVEKAFFPCEHLVVLVSIRLVTDGCVEDVDVFASHFELGFGPTLNCDDAKAC